VYPEQDYKQGKSLEHMAENRVRGVFREQEGTVWLRGLREEIKDYHGTWYSVPSP